MQKGGGQVCVSVCATNWVYKIHKWAASGRCSPLAHAHTQLIRTSISIGILPWQPQKNVLKSKEIRKGSRVMEGGGEREEEQEEWSGS